MKNTILCTFIALLSQPLFAGERVTLEARPAIRPDSYTIDLSLIPQAVEFEGFINYGSPIATAASAFTAAGVQNGSTQTNITPNVIDQPIFSTRKVTASVSIFDGQTVVLGGLVREDAQKVEDKLGELIKERDQLKRRLTELEALIQGLSKP